MVLQDADVRAALRRMLNAGALTHLPKRRGDLDVLLALACAPFERNRAYREDDVNDRLGTWLERFTVQPMLDHVTIRRYLVDAQFLLRDPAGMAYRVNTRRLDELLTESARRIDPGSELTALTAERERRKRERESAS